jgi:hypothetical protein
MIQLLAIVIGAFVLFTYPKVFFIGIFLAGVLWFLSRPIEDLNKETPEEEGSYYFDMKKKANEELDKRMKPGFDKDPEWIKLHNRLKRHVERKERNSKDEIIAEQEAEIKDMKRRLRQNGQL